MTALAAPWDEGVRWFTRRIEPPTESAASMEFIRGQVLRVVNGSAEDEFIDASIQAATEAYEDYTQRALMPQTWELVLDKFPAGKIVLPRPPLIAVTSVAYVDGAGDPQTLASSPADYRVVPSGKYARAELWPLSGASWPSTIAQGDAVTVTFTAGCPELDEAPELSLAIAGIGLFVGELYKQRSFSVQGPNNLSALQVDRFWKRLW